MWGQTSAFLFTVLLLGLLAQVYRAILPKVESSEKYWKKSRKIDIKSDGMGKVSARRITPPVLMVMLIGYDDHSPRSVSPTDDKVPGTSTLFTCVVTY